MKMKNKKFLSIATTLGLSLSMLSACGTPAVDTNKDDDDDDDRAHRNGGAVVAPVVPGKASDSTGIKSGSSSKSSTVKGGSSGIGKGSSSGASS